MLSTICPGSLSFQIHLKPRTIKLTDLARSKLLLLSTYQTQEQDGYYDPDSGKTFLFYMVVFETTGSESDYDHDNTSSRTNAYWDQYGNLNRWNSGYMPYWFRVYSEPRFFVPSFYNMPYAHFDGSYDNYYTSVLGW